ncbi:hypothetical protein [Kitasatospora sp. NPDC127060]
MPITTSTWSDWCNGKSTPSDGDHFLAVIKHLGEKAHGKPLTAQQVQIWKRRLAAAKAESNRNRGGRPPKPQPPEPPAVRKARDRRERVFNRHSAWIKQHVRASRLHERQAELRELEAFCLAPEGEGQLSPYACWQAGPWAGKSALMAEFATRQRPADVDVVSYFIAERLGNNNRDDFLTAVSEQLSALADREAPRRSGSAGELPELFRAAAEACQGRGRRLVLLVDGLDEDSGGGPGGQSIAALLPKDPPPGMCVVVTGRPNPPVPDGVPGDHPLHDRRIVRSLAPSEQAKSIEKRAVRELWQLLRDEPVGKDLLGFVVVSQGGLTGEDLAALVGRPSLRVSLAEINTRLRGITGRSFAVDGTNDLLPDVEAGSRAYALAHRELHRTALAELGDAATAEYLERLHAWADTYRTRGWPADTPAYLLDHYPRLLRRLGDTERLTRHAIDTARHERLWWVTGDDDQALREIDQAFQLQRAEACADLVACARLAHLRQALLERVGVLPASLIVTLAHIGRAERAIALAGRRTFEMPSLLLRILQAAKSRPDAVKAAREAASHIADPCERAESLTGIARALGDAGDRAVVAALAEEAAAAAETITDSYKQAQCLTYLAETLVRTAHWDEAVAVVSGVGYPGQRTRAQATIAQALAKAGHCDRAIVLAREAAASAEEIADSYLRARVLAEIAHAMALAGRPNDAACIAGTITDRLGQTHGLDETARALAEAGYWPDAVTLARIITRPVARAQTLAAVARTQARAGHHDGAVALAEEVAATAEMISDDADRAKVLAASAGVLADAGWQDVAASRAAAAARTVSDSDQRGQALAAVMRELAAAGDRRGAVTLAWEAASAARDQVNPGSRDESLGGVVRDLSQAGLPDVAIDVASAITAPNKQGKALAGVVSALAKAGDHENATSVARSITHRGSRVEALAAVAQSMAQAGLEDEATEMAKEVAVLSRSTTTPADPRYLLDLARALAEADLLDEAAALARTATDHCRDPWFLAGIASVLGVAGYHDEAVGIAERMSSPSLKAKALAETARALAEAGKHEVAVAMARDAAAVTGSVTDTEQQAQAWTDIARALAEAGRLDEALDAAHRSSTGTFFGYWQKRPLLIDITRRLARGGRYEDATALADTLTGDYLRGQALTTIAREIISLGRRDDATTRARQVTVLARSLADPYEQARLLAVAAQVLAQAGHRGEAADLAREATTAARIIDHPEMRVSALRAIASTFARAGQPNGALAITEEVRALEVLHPSDASDRALTFIIEPLASIGHISRAVAVARTIADEASRAQALAAIARTCTDTAQARTLLAEVLDTPHWRVAVRPLARLDPHALSAMAELERVGL